MDIIATHRHGLIEQLDEDVAALAGGSHDHVQRAMVLHHIYDHSGGNHLWALAEARRGLMIAARLVTLRKRVERWGWMMGGREEARVAINLLSEALAEEARRRAVVAYRAYRLSATAAIRSEAEAAIPPALLACFDRCHSARRSGEKLPIEHQHELAVESERFVQESVVRAQVDVAWYTIEKTSLMRAARRLLGENALKHAAERDERRGWARIERELTGHPSLPASFRANPAQHFYALQQMLRNRRHQQWREACDREPDAFELAA
jgi:hypothetical protein